MYDPSDDNTIWESFCAGNQPAFIALYNKYYTMLFVWGCRWMDGDPDFVKDELHDFFIYLWEKKENLAKDIKVHSYLLTSFRRQLVSQRKTRATPVIDINAVEASKEDDLASGELMAEQFRELERALSLLTPSQREVIELRFLHRLSLQEIAGKKNTSLRTVYNLMHRGLRSLREETIKKTFCWLW